MIRTGRRRTGKGSFYTHTMRPWIDKHGVLRWQLVPRDHTNQIMTTTIMNDVRYNKGVTPKAFKASVGKYYGKKVPADSRRKEADR
jgi:outer membrane lipoprotein-sorting protein